MKERSWMKKICIVILTIIEEEKTRKEKMERLFVS